MKKLLAIVAVLVIAFSAFIATSNKPVGKAEAAKPTSPKVSFKKPIKKVSVAKAKEIVVAEEAMEIVVTEQPADKSVVIEDVGAQVNIGVAKSAAVVITEAQFMALPKK